MTWTENPNRLGSTLETCYVVRQKFPRLLYTFLHNDQSAYCFCTNNACTYFSVLYFLTTASSFSTCLSLYFYFPHGKQSFKSDLGAETRAWEITKHICISMHTFSKSLDGCCNVQWILWKLHKSNNMQVVNFIYTDML